MSVKALIIDRRARALQWLKDHHNPFYARFYPNMPKEGLPGAKYEVLNVDQEKSDPVELAGKLGVNDEIKE